MYVFCTDCMRDILHGLNKDALNVLAELSTQRSGQAELMAQMGVSIYQLRAALNCLRGARLITLDLDKKYVLSANGERLLDLVQKGVIR